MNGNLRWGQCAACLLAVSLAAVEIFAADPVPQYPLAVAATADGKVFVADRNLPGIWQIVDDRPVLYFQGSKKFRTPLNAIRCLAIDREGRLLAGDSSTREVYRFDDQNQPQPLTKGGVGIPMSLAVDADGAIWVADLEIHRIVKIPAAGGTPEIMAEVPAPRGLAFDPQGKLWIVSQGADQVLTLSADSKQRETIVAGQPFSFPHQLAFDPAGAAYVTDGYSKAVWKVVPGMPPQKLLSGPPLDNPVGIAAAGDQLLVVDPRAKALFRLNTAGQIVSTVSLGVMVP